MSHSGTHGEKREGTDTLEHVQQGNRAWWESTPMTYDWRGESALEPLTDAWFDDQDRRSVSAHAHFATDRIPFDRFIPYAELAGREVLEIGVGSGFHAELIARAGARVTGIDLTESAIERTRARFALRGLEGTFERWDAEQPREEFERRFDFVWSWGVIHHSSRTARIVRNVERWTGEEGAFAGMVYHRGAVSAGVALLREGILRGGLRTRTVDEILWQSTDGYSARFYPAEQWRDLLLAFFEEADVEVNGIESDAVPLPRRLRERVAPHVPERLRERVQRRAGSFVTFTARRPVRV